jgi:hypothetical protein
MDYPGVSGGFQDSSVETQPDKRWLGTLLCCLSALVTTVFIVLLATAVVSNDDKDIARGDDQGVDSLSPPDGVGRY